MVSSTQLHENEEFISELQMCAQLLVEKLQGDQYQEAATLIHSLLETRDRHIFQSVGRLTRGLHNAIVNFHVDGDIDREPPIIEGSEIRDASHRLNYVIDLTQKAAEKTMDMVEESAPIAMELGLEASALRDEWGRLKRREMTASEFRELYGRIDSFLEQMTAGSDRLNQNLQHIILEQGFQDLTGQVLKRVISLISEVESDLVSLVRIAGQVEEITGIAQEIDDSGKLKSRKKDATEGPQINKDRKDIVTSQDEVDDLLSSLGF